MRAACRALATALATLVLAGCSGNGGGSGGDSASATVTVQGDVPLAYVKRSVSVRMNPTNGAPFAPGGDLMLREKSSPSAPEHNLTATLHAGTGRRVGPRGVIRRQADRLRTALPEHQHIHRGGRAGLHRALEPVALRRWGRRARCSRARWSG
jgi:hypothetical protein